MSHKGVGCVWVEEHALEVEMCYREGRTGVDGGLYPRGRAVCDLGVYLGRVKVSSIRGQDPRNRLEKWASSREES